MTYRMSLGMAENLVNQISQKQALQQQHQPTTTITTAKSGESSSHGSSSISSAVESLGKKIVGGIKLPFVSHSSSSSSHTPTPTALPTSAPSTSEAENSSQPDQSPIVGNHHSSRSKRPISAQMYELPTVGATPIVKTSSNENIIESVMSSKDTASSDDDLDVVGKTTVHHHESKVSWKEQGGNSNNGISSKTADKSSSGSTSVPVPAPRKTKSIMKQFFGGLGINPTAAAANNATPSSPPPTTPTTTNSTSQQQSPSSKLASSSPKLPRKIDTINEETGSVNSQDTSNQLDEVRIRFFIIKLCEISSLKIPKIRNLS